MHFLPARHERASSVFAPASHPCRHRGSGIRSAGLRISAKDGGKTCVFRQRLADIQAAIDAIRSHLQRGGPSDGALTEL